MKKTFQIKGMHCASCEILISKSLEDSGFMVQHISSKDGKLVVDFDAKQEKEKSKNYKKIQEIITESGYSLDVGKNKLDLENKSDKNLSSSNGLNHKIISNKKNLNRRLQLFVILLVWLVTFALISHSGIYDQIFSHISSGGGILLAILLGFVASISTCLAITGSVVLGFSAYITENNNQMNIKTVNIKFQIGRIVGFLFFGGILGTIGQFFTISPNVGLVINIIIAVLVVYMGLQILGFVPNFSKIWVFLPKSFSSKILKLNNPNIAPIVGALTFFLPCGFTQSVQLMAIGTGSFVSGALMMGAFALGTAPVLWGVGVGSGYITKNKFGLISKFIGVLIVLFGVFSLYNYSSLLPTDTNNNTNINNTNINYEIISLSHDGQSLVPERVELSAGKSYQIEIIPETDGIGCMSTMILQGIDRTPKQILKGQKITYKMINPKAGTYKIVCGSMGMRQGEIVIK